MCASSKVVPRAGSTPVSPRTNAAGSAVTNSLHIMIVTKELDLILSRASLSLAEVITFRVCAASATMQGYRKQDFADFLTLVLMADAEIIHLQREGFAYLR